MWARHLDSEVRIVTPADATDNDRNRVQAASKRLLSMGLDVAVDEVHDMDRDIATIVKTRRGARPSRILPMDRRDHAAPSKRSPEPTA